MAPSTEPTALLSHLHRTDGSATFSQNGYTVIGAVNGPLEAGRREELPEEAVVDVIVRPAAGVAGTRERQLESILQSTLRQIILINNFPRSLIQVTLQITSTPENENAGSKLVQAASNLPILPALLQTAILALLSASMPLTMTATSAFLALTSDGSARSIITNPTIVQCESADSVHVLAFTSHGDLLVAESEGSFSLQDWETVFKAAKSICCDDSKTNVDHSVMQDGELGDEKGGMMNFVKSTLQTKITADLHWKD
ncbi:uncharacterized protein LY89DRAFT_728842 [Mollisia scopiformis]|uniref:Exoribonuclease phosphorolytic domain-containing protein n=1 Tax=Mollisia scopiformis TaxID=149040 RepID=A0A194XRA5_MOLSC|nr:uncharacterized protein LY89DRAFT_728842 [Mollisia scopiformis]KUJ22723.1 hypothetical protein LY89DRAFT_728842 [Mollisia scopiformis]